MPLVRTTLPVAITADATTFAVTSTATGFPAVGQFTSPQQAILIDDEIMFLVYVPVANTVVVRSRGADGTTALPHQALSGVVTSTNMADFPPPPPGNLTLRPVATFQDVLTYSADGLIAPPLDDLTISALAKTSAGAWTLAAPSLALSGARLVFTTTSAFAHVISGVSSAGATAIFNTGVTGSPFTTCTFAAFVGSSITLTATNGFWHLTANTGPAAFS